MTKQKTIPQKMTVSEFLSKIENNKRVGEAKIIIKIMKSITGKKAVMWGPSIIGFGRYEYKYDSGHEGTAPLVGFSPRKTKHVFYVLTNFKNQDKLLEKLGKHKTGKVCLYINKLEDIELSILEKIIECSYKDAVKKHL